MRSTGSRGHWHGAPLKGKPVAVIGASTGMFGAVWAQAETRKVLGAIGARVLDAELPVPNADEQFDVDGALRDEAIAAELEALTSELVGLASERTLSPAA